MTAAAEGAKVSVDIPGPDEAHRLRWTQVLDDFEATLAEQERQLDEDPSAKLAAFTPPSGIGPMPSGLSGRASQLLIRAGLLGDRLAAQLAGTGRQLALARSLAGDGPGYAAYLDRMV